MKYSMALDKLLIGKKLTRTGWNGKGMWIILIDDWTIGKKYEKTVKGLLPISFIAMKTKDNKFVPWLASQTDILSNDWLIIK